MSEQSGSAEFVLAGDFPEPTAEQWEKEVLKVLNRGRPEGKELTIEQAYKRLQSASVDDLKYKPLYTIADAVDDQGYPGSSPFTRGTTIRDGAMDAWDVCQLHEDPDVATSRDAVVTDLERGCTSIWVRLDPDAISPTDLAQVLGGVKLEAAPVMVSSRSDQAAAAEALLSVLKDSGRGADDIVGNLGVDPIGHAALNGTAPQLAVAVDAYKKAVAWPKLTPLVVDSTIYHNAGAGDVQELAYAIATGLEYVRALTDAGIDLDDAFGAMLFRVSASTDQFNTMARLRALRMLWARVGEVLGVSESSKGARQHAVTSYRQITRDDPYVNMLRATIQTFAASAGGAESITVLPFDAAWGLPDAFARRIARNTQIVLAEESNIGRVNDPGGGGWYLESLTAQLGQAAWQLFGELDAEGMAANVANGTVKAQIARTVADRAKLLANRSIPLTGVSMFPNMHEAPLSTRPRPAAPTYAGLSPVRDAELFEALRDRASGSGAKVVLACLGARRDFGAREGFTSNVFQVAGIATPLIEGATAENVAAQLDGAKVAVLCSNAKMYAEHALPVAKALKAAGVTRVLLAGSIKEIGAGDPSGLIDGTVFAGMDVVELLESTLDELGVAK